MAGERDLASLYPDVVKRIESIMTEEHVDHPWYHNPGETDEQWKAKQRRAEELGYQRADVEGNTTY